MKNKKTYTCDLCNRAFEEYGLTPLQVNYKQPIICEACLSKKSFRLEHLIFKGYKDPIDCILRI